MSCDNTSLSFLFLVEMDPNDEYILWEHLVVISDLLFDSIEHLLSNQTDSTWVGDKVRTVVVLSTQLSKPISAMMETKSRCVTEKMMCAYRLRHVAKLLLMTKGPVGLCEWGPRQRSSLESIHAGKFHVLYGHPETGIFRNRTMADRRIGWTLLMKWIIMKMKKRFSTQNIRIVSLSRFLRFNELIPTSHIVKPRTYKALIDILTNAKVTVPLVLFDWPLSEYFPKETTTQEQFDEERKRLDTLNMILVY
jgi:hypothetical protein